MQSATNPFLWATGIEDTFVPHARPGQRSLDEYALTQHYERWREDCDLVAASGVQAVRWGIPWYRVQPAPEQWDWRWTDEALDYLVNVKGVAVILDLMHYGTPLWLDNSFINAGYPQRVAEYACNVAERYRGLVHMYTPLNEPAVNAEFCGRRGEWPPYLAGEDGFVKVLLALARGIQLTTQALRAAQPDACLVQVEALGHFWSHDPALAAEVAAVNERQYLAFDLCTGRVDDTHPLHLYLRRHGVSEAELQWFHYNAVRFDWLGANFYPWSYGEVYKRNGDLVRRHRPTPGNAIAQVVRNAYERYGLPVMVTETSSLGSQEIRAAWMDETIGAVQELRTAGIPVVGYTWFPLFSMFDWAYRRGRRPLEKYLIHLGLYELEFDGNGRLERTATPLVARYQNHILHEA
jgi:beta-glucosidase